MKGMIQVNPVPDDIWCESAGSSTRQEEAVVFTIRRRCVQGFTHFLSLIER